MNDTVIPTISGASDTPPSRGTIPQTVHLVGVGGVHMSGIAQILRHRGHDVTGSDLQSSPLTQKVEGSASTVYRRVTRRQHWRRRPRRLHLRRPRGQPGADRAARGAASARSSAAEMVAWLQEGKQVIAVAGAHGKTTTSALIAYMLWRAGLDPTFMIGGERARPGTNASPARARTSSSKPTSTTARFSTTTPTSRWSPTSSRTTWTSTARSRSWSARSTQFLSQIDQLHYIVACTDSPPYGPACHDDNRFLPTVGDDMIANPVHVVSYSLHKEADWTAENIVSKGIDGLSFVVKFRKQTSGGSN